MLTKNYIIKSIVVSIFVTFLMFITSSIFFSYGITWDSAIDWNKVNAMPYAKALKYIESHSKTVSGWEIFLTEVKHPSGWWLSFGIFLVGDVLYLLGCLVLLWWTDERPTT